MHIPRVHREDVMIIVELSCLGAKAKMGEGGHLERTGFKAIGPFISRLVLQFHFQ